MDPNVAPKNTLSCRWYRTVLSPPPLAPIGQSVIDQAAPGPYPTLIGAKRLRQKRLRSAEACSGVLGPRRR